MADKMDVQDPMFAARVIAKMILLSEIIPKLLNPGRTTAMALRIVAKIAETEEDITEEMIKQELEFLLADQAFK